MPGPDRHAWLFAIKTCTAALVALFIALALSLDRPSWSVTTVFIASQLYAGATVSKSVYRLLGTCLGAVATVVMVPALVQTPVLLCLALAAWVSGCLFVSLLDRSPRSYIFMLAGYSAAFIGFPAVDTPLAIFDLAVARVEEISLGVLCSSLVHTLVLPRFVQQLIEQKIAGWLVDARQWWEELAVSPGASHRGRNHALTAKLAGYPPLLEAMGTHLAYEGGGGREAARTVHHLVMVQSLLLPLIASLDERLGIARRQGLTVPAAVQDLIDELPHCIASSEHSDKLNRARQAAAPVSGARRTWEGLFWQSFVARVEELLGVLASVSQLRQMIQARFNVADGSVPKPPRRPQLDLGLAALSALTAFCSIVAGCAVWILTGWQDGASVPMIAAVGCSFFAALDTPIPSMKVFARYVVVSVVVTLAYTSVLLPLAGSFEMAALALAPAFIALGLLMANPATAFIGMVLSTNIATLTGLNNNYSGDFIGTLNGAFATLCGIVLTMAVMSLMRARTPAWRGRRIMQSALEDVQSCLFSDVGDGHFPLVRRAFVQRMIDRLHQVVPRLEADKVLEGYLLAELRLGANVLDLRNAGIERSEGAVMAHVKELMEGLGNYVSSKQARLDLTPPPALQGLLDRTLVACQQDERMPQRGLESLLNIRLVLFPEARPLG